MGSLTGKSFSKVAKVAKFVQREEIQNSGAFPQTPDSMLWWVSNISSDSIKTFFNEIGYYSQKDKDVNVKLMYSSINRTGFYQLDITDRCILYDGHFNGYLTPFHDYFCNRYYKKNARDFDKQLFLTFITTKKLFWSFAAKFFKSYFEWFKTGNYSPFSFTPTFETSDGRCIPFILNNSLERAAFVFEAVLGWSDWTSHYPLCGYNRSKADTHVKFEQGISCFLAFEERKHIWSLHIWREGEGSNP